MRKKIKKHYHAITGELLDDGTEPMSQEDWDDLVERMQSQNSGHMPTEEE